MGRKRNHAPTGKVREEMLKRLLPPDPLPPDEKLRARIENQLRRMVKRVA